MLIKNLGSIFVIVFLCLPIISFADFDKGDVHNPKIARHASSQGKLARALDSCEQGATSIHCMIKALEESNLNLKNQIESLTSSNKELKAKLESQETISTNSYKAIIGRLEKLESSWIAYISLGISLLSLLYYFVRARYATLANLGPIVNVERSIGENKDDEDELLKFHGINKGMLQKAGINTKQLAYLVSNFTAGRIYDQSSRLWPFFKKPSWLVRGFDKNHYRYKMLQQEETQNAWELIKVMMIEDGYIVALEKTLKKIKKIN